MLYEYISFEMLNSKILRKPISIEFIKVNWILIDLFFSLSNFSPIEICTRKFFQNLGKYYYRCLQLLEKFLQYIKGLFIAKILHLKICENYRDYYKYILYRSSLGFGIPTRRQN